MSSRNGDDDEDVLGRLKPMIPLIINVTPISEPQRQRSGYP